MQGALRMRHLFSRLAVLAVWLAAAVDAHAQAEVRTVALDLAPQAASAASIHGTVVSADGAVYQGARVELALSGGGAPVSQQTDDEGAFRFTNLPAGSFRLIVSSSGFETREIAGVLQRGEIFETNAITLPVANAAAVIQVSAESEEELAQEQLNLELEQRVLGVIPNYYVSYDPNAAPLTPRQKYELAWKSEFDPVTVLMSGFVAGVEQAPRHLRRIWPGRAGIWQAAGGKLRGRGCGHSDRRRGSSLVVQAGSAVLLQGNGKRSSARRLRNRERGDLQRR